MAIGDDWGDEDIFKAMPREAYTIKVGNSYSVAKYHVDTCEEARQTLSRLVQARRQEQSPGALMTG